MTILAVGLAGALVAGSVGAGVRSGRASTAVRATLGSPAQPRATGVFVASLTGKTLSWRLTFHGLAASVSAAHLHLGKPGRTGPIAARLCAPCVSGAAGKVTVRSATATGLRQRAAYVDVHTGRGAIRGQVALGTVPTLQLLLSDGDTLHLPAAVRYAVTGFRVGRGAGGIVAATEGGNRVELQLGREAGVAYLPDDKMLTGKRDLTFTLTQADGTPLTNREASVTVFDILFTGRR